MKTCMRKRYFCLFIPFVLLTSPFFTSCTKESKSMGSLLLLASNMFSGEILILSPQNVTATDGDFSDHVTITWNAAENADHYRVYRSETTDAEDFVLIADDVEPITYDDGSMTPDMMYYYKVSTISGAVESPLSGYDSGFAGSVTKLPAPNNVTATDGTSNDSVTLTWNIVTEAAHYHVYRADSDVGPYSLIGDDIILASYVDITVTPGTTYYYKVAAVSDIPEEGDLSDSNAGYAVAQPSAPTNLTASKGSKADSVDLTWDTVTGADHYHLYRDTDLNGSYAQVGDDIIGTSYSDSSVTPDTHYYYKITAYDTDLEGNPNAIAESQKSGAVEGWALAETILPSPSGVSATLGDYTDKVTVSWNSVDDADYYWVYRSGTSDGIYEKISGDVYATAFDDTTVSVGIHYFYKVKAATATKESDYSDSCEGYAMVDPPLDAPSNVQASDATSTDSVAVTWDPVTDATYYRVYRSLTSAGDYTLISGDVAAASYNDTDTFEDTTYYYKVKAFNATKESAFSSNIASGKCDITPFEYLIRFNLDWDRMFRKLADRSDFPPTGAKSYTISGLISGSTSVVVSVPGWNQAATNFSHSSYNDYGMVFSGSEVTSTDWGGSGTHTGTVTTSGSFNGSVAQSLTVTSKLRTGGTFTPTYGGSSTAVDWSTTRGVNGLLIQVPHHLSATMGTDASRVVITWAPVYAAPVYEIYRATSAGGTYSLIGQVSGTWLTSGGTVYSYYDTTATPGTHYFYRIRVVNDLLINDLDGDQKHDADETAYSDYSSPVEGYR
ncbi:MAG: hypothetical protein JW807_06890 [Spirochaetes bacterium]|nr:hypothetical protein [Spirochaetota bacterium]